MSQSFPILVIDDDESIPLILTHAGRTSFPEAEFTFMSSAHQAQNALLTPTARLPRLLLLDVNLNDTVDGLQLLARIRADSYLFTLPVLMISANEHRPPVYEAYHSGATSFATKPYGLQAWKSFLVALRQYWFETVTLLPPTYYTP